MDARQQTGKVETRCSKLALVKIPFLLLGKCDGCHARPHVCVRGVAEHVEVFHRCGTDLVWVRLGLVDHPSSQLVQIIHCSFEGLGELCQLRIRIGYKGANLIDERLIHGAATADDLAADQVQCLNAIGALVDLSDPAVTHQLLLTPLTNEAVAAEDLLAMNRGFQPHIGKECFGYWRQQRHLSLGTQSRLVVIAELGDIELQRDIAGEGPATLV